MSNKKGSLVRLCRYTINAVLAHRVPVETPDKQADVIRQGYKVRMNSRRYKVFSESIVCHVCGLRGEFFELERFPNQKERGALKCATSSEEK